MYFKKKKSKAFKPTNKKAKKPVKAVKKLDDEEFVNSLKPPK